MMFLTTRTETEALLLEQNLIKQLKPRYNVLLRDDKSFPNIIVAKGPRLSADPQASRCEEVLWQITTVPFASAGAVNRTLNQLQKVFQLRNCYGFDLREPDAALPALPDKTLQRALRRLYRRRLPMRTSVADAERFLSGQVDQYPERRSPSR